MYEVCLTFISFIRMQHRPLTSSTQTSRQLRPGTLAVLFSLALLLLSSSCESGKVPLKVPPHLELGQQLIIEGGEPGKSYTVIGYREQAGSVTEKTYYGQEYIVFTYINDIHDIKQAVIHENSIKKK